ncbi:SpoIVB peptidase [Hespellia stercorisuis]|uniref:Stage IV sporulation protein B n=1 Tax=Hespellia stercorisuis DSM 15480 TaxID=1121950 RepID=A0A1M6HMB9_9FIRM|nr:SpoIVB peptidase [Hespellia stercorisuis]SHJ23381.1 stage IV sporulation protein B [Hespellia stercorisuis DSM 15480]
MRKLWYRRILILIAAMTTAVTLGYYGWYYREVSERLEAGTTHISDDVVLLGGMPIGIYMETDGVMVIDTDKIKSDDGKEYSPAKKAVQPGDYITAFNGVPVQSKKKLVTLLKDLGAEKVELEIRRADQELAVEIEPVESVAGDYKLGIWVRDNVQGLGTITFLDEKSRFGALGHGIHDTDTGGLLQIEDGTVYQTSVRAITKGKFGIPGNMEGIIVYNNFNKLGTVTDNTETGIYGSIEKIDELFAEQIPVQVGEKSDIEIGPAQIYCSVDGEVEPYEIQIIDIDYTEKEVNKGLVIEVTDQKLLDITGGIVQGMSGSPIVQNDRLIGAVTHVFVRNPAKGYGIFIGNMIENLQ